MGRPLAATHWRRPGPDARRLSPDRDLCSGCLHAPTRSAAPASVADPAPDAELWRCIPVPGPVVTEGRNARPVGACRALRATGGGGRSKAAPTLRNAAKLERLLGRLPAPGGETGDSGIRRRTDSGGSRRGRAVKFRAARCALGASLGDSDGRIKRSAGSPPAAPPPPHTAPCRRATPAAAATPPAPTTTPPTLRPPRLGPI